MINISLDDGVAAALRAKAATQGLTIEAYLEMITRSDAARSSPRISPDELDRLLDAEGTREPSPRGTFSRAELYGDHD